MIACRTTTHYYSFKTKFSPISSLEKEMTDLLVTIPRIPLKNTTKTPMNFGI
jgi:hypothetical protein